MIEVRSAEQNDIAAMAVLRAQEWESEAYWVFRIGGYLRGEQSPQQAALSRAVLVAVDGPTVVGFVAGHQTRRFGCDGELQWINVARESRGQGIAGQLIAEIGEWFVSEGFSRICVNVEPDNSAARGLYRRFGAEPLNDYWMVWGDARRMIDDAPPTHPQ